MNNESENKIATKGITKTLFIMTVFVVITKLLGLLRDSVLAYCYGTSKIADAYIIALSIPTVLFASLGKAISTALVPLYLKHQDEDKTNNTDVSSVFLFKIFFFGLLISGLILIIIELFPTILITIFASGFDAETINICANILRIGAFSIFFMFLTSVCSALALTKRKYIAITLISLPMNVILIISLFLSMRTSYIVLGYGIFLAFSSEFLFLIPFLFKQNIKIKPSFKKTGSSIGVFKMVVPIFVGSTMSQINHVVDKSIASNFDFGSVSALNFSSTINVAIQELFVTGLLNVIFAEYSKQLIEKEIGELKDNTEQILKMLRVFLIPVTVFVLLNAESIVRILFMRGSFDERSLLMTSITLIFYGFGIYFVSFRDVIVKIFYANKNAIIPGINSVISIGINVGLNFLLGYYMGVSGIALATSISAIISSVFLLIVFQKKFFKLDIRRHLFHLMKLLVFSFLCVLPSFSLLKGLNSIIPNQNINFIISGLIFCVLYYFALTYSGDSSLKSLLGSAFKKRKND